MNFLQFPRLSLAEAFEGEECNNFLSFLAMRHYVGPHRVNLRLTIITPVTPENPYVVVAAVLPLSVLLHLIIDHVHLPFLICQGTVLLLLQILCKSLSDT